MRRLFSTLALLSCLPLSLTACADPEAGDTASDGGADSGGKTDDLGDGECAPTEELRLELVGRDKNESVDGDELQNSVTATCFNDNGFEDAQCCADAELFDAYTDATSCPSKVVLEDAGDAQRCRDAGTGTFVNSACCSDVCDPDARRNSNGQCIDSGGQFEDELCCFLASSLEANSCDGAVWVDIVVDDEPRTACRNQETGRFAMNSCCAAECVAAVSAGELSGSNVPLACEAAVDLVDPAEECPAGSRENTAGICHNPEDGQFVKAACCEAQPETPIVLACNFDLEPVFGVDDSEALEGAVGSDNFISLDIETETEGVEREQLEATVLHLGFLVPGQERRDADLYEVSDDGSFQIFTGTVNDIDIDWVQFFAGDTEVGVIFEAGTTNIIGEVGDGDIRGCDATRIEG